MARPTPDEVERRGALVIALHDEEGLTLEEISTRLGVSMERVRQIYNRAMRRRRLARKAGKSPPEPVTGRIHPNWLTGVR